MDKRQSGLIKRTIYKFHRNAFNKEALAEWPHLKAMLSPFQAWPAPSLSATRGGPRQASDGSGGMCGVCGKKCGVDWTSQGTQLPPDLGVRTSVLSPSSNSLEPVQSRLPSLPMVKETWDLCVTWHPSQSPNCGSRAPSLPPLITKSPNSHLYPWAQETGGLGARLRLETLNSGVL